MADRVETLMWGGGGRYLMSMTDGAGETTYLYQPPAQAHPVTISTASDRFKGIIVSAGDTVTIAGDGTGTLQVGVNGVGVDLTPPAAAAPPIVIHRPGTSGDTIDVTRYDDGAGHYHEVGRSVPTSPLDPAYDWVKIYVPHDGRNAIGPKDGGRGTVEYGSTRYSNGVSSHYTVGVDYKPDGSSTWWREEHYSDGHDIEGYGARDAEGNHSESYRVTSRDGSWEDHTLTIDKDGNGTDHVTAGDKDGTVTNDYTKEVHGSKPGGGAGPSGEEDPEHPHPESSSPVGDDSPGAVEGNPDGALDRDLVRRLLRGAGGHQNEELDVLGDAAGRLGPWLDRIAAAIAAGQPIGGEGEVLDTLGAGIHPPPLTGTGGHDWGDLLDDLGGPVIRGTIVPGDHHGGPIDTMLDLRAQLGTGRAAIETARSLFASG